MIIPSPDDQEQIITIHDHEEIESKLIERNIAHFGQAQGSPFTVPRMSETLGYEGTNEYSKQIIQGEDLQDDMNNMTRGVRNIIGMLNNGEQTPTFKIDITLSKFLTGFRKWKEATSTSPSGRHLGQYKALIRAESPETTEEKSTIPKIKNPLGHRILTSIFHVTMATVLSGETLDRWKNVYSAMIEKIPGRPLVSKLRVIHLYEADYNLLLKLMWSRQLTWQAHLNNTLHPSQAGSRPGKKAIDIVVYKEQKYHLL